MALRVPSAMSRHPLGNREVRQSPPDGYYFMAYPDTVSRLNIAKIQIKSFHKDLIFKSFAVFFCQLKRYYTLYFL